MSNSSGYFEAGVVERYRDQPERYHVFDTESDGSVLVRDQYYDSLDEGERDNEWVYIRYDKRTKSDGGQLLLAWPPDFEKLPMKHKLHWKSWEVGNPKLIDVQRDVRFARAVAQNLYGEFLDVSDPIWRIKEVVRLIVEEFGVYKRWENPALHYPHLNNRRDYSSSHGELRKLVGPDNMNVKAIKRYGNKLGLTFGPENGAWSPFKKLVRAIDGGDDNRILPALERCNRERSLVAHEIEDNPSLNDENYVELFHGECADVVNAVDRLLVLLRSHVRNKEKGELAHG